MNCRNIERKLYLYTELTEEEKGEVDDHLKTCVSCRELWSSIAVSKQRIQTVASIRAQPENAARLTQRIMSGVQQSAAPRIRLSILDTIFGNGILRYSLSGLSVVLIILFAAEFYRVPTQPTNNALVATEATVPLHSAAFKETYSRMKGKYTACRSPFQSADSYRACLLNKFK